MSLISFFCKKSFLKSSISTAKFSTIKVLLIEDLLNKGAKGEIVKVLEFFFYLFFHIWFKGKERTFQKSALSKKNCWYLFEWLYYGRKIIVSVVYPTEENLKAYASLIEGRNSKTVASSMAWSFCWKIFVMDCYK